MVTAATIEDNKNLEATHETGTTKNTSKITIASFWQTDKT